MSEDFVTMDFHNEYAKRMEEEHRRQNHRITEVEEALKEYNKLAVTIERLTISVQSMVEELKDQRDRLTELEDRDGEMWRKAVGHVITTMIGIAVGFIFSQIGM